MRRSTPLLAMFVALALPAVALAGGTTGQAGYGGKAGTVQSAIVKSHPGRATGTLPFTGQGLLLPLLAAAFMIVAGGLVLRRTRKTTA
jgi:hypothetical protein